MDAAAIKSALLAANRATYLAAMQRIAAAANLPEPDDLTDEDEEGLDERAEASADSIADTDEERRQSFLAQHKTEAEALAALLLWRRQHADMVARYESAMTVSVAAAIFIKRNDLEGTEHLEPFETAGCDDECDDALEQGEQSIGTLGDFPAHPNCPHYLVYSFDTTP